MKSPAVAPVAGLILSLFCFAGPGSAQDPSFPDLIPLPDGSQPEGITLGVGHDLFAGSREDGSIYRADLRTGAGMVVIVAQADRSAFGLSFDPRSGLLFVAGGPAGEGYVYDTLTGNSVAVYTFAGAPGTFVNDVVVTRDAAYFTDSFQPFLYRLPLGPAGELPDPSAVQTIPLGGDFVSVSGNINANGVVSSDSGEWLIVVNSTLGTLYRVDPQTGDATEIDLGADTVESGDGLVREGLSLYVVQNFLNQIAVVELAPDLASGQIVSFIVSPSFDTPTTAAKFGSRLYAVNARFGTPPGPATEYDIVLVHE